MSRTLSHLFAGWHSPLSIQMELTCARLTCHLPMTVIYVQSRDAVCEYVQKVFGCEDVLCAIVHQQLLLTAPIIVAMYRILLFWSIATWETSCHLLGRMGQDFIGLLMLLFMTLTWSLRP